jgi:antitoxin (DNA-binding transcriptional repressor) of toxin-antitoxin stability system
MSKSIGKREFLLHASKYLHWVEDTGRELVVTHRDEATVRVVPVRPRDVASLRGFIASGDTEGLESLNEPVLPAFDEW